MPINLALNEKLIEEAVRMGNHRTKREAVTTALQEYIKMQRRLGLLDLAGTIEYDPNYDYKADRRRSDRTTRAASAAQKARQ